MNEFQTESKAIKIMNRKNLYFIFTLFFLIYFLPKNIFAQTTPVILLMDNGKGSSVSNHGYSNVTINLYKGAIVGNGATYGPAWSTDVPFQYTGNYSILLHGGNDNISLVSSSMDFTVKNYTVEAWIKPQLNNAVYEYISQASTHSNSALQFRLERVNSSLKLEALIRNNTTAAWDTMQSDTGSIKVNQWQHVAVTFDSTAGSKLYINGQAVDSIGAAPAVSIVKDWIVGSRTANSFQGNIDDFRISDFARVPGDGSGKDTSQAWNNTVGYPADSAQVAILKIAPGYATNDGKNTNSFVIETLNSNDIPFTFIDPSVIQQETNPEVIYKYKLVIIPYFSYGQEQNLQLDTKYYYQWGGRVIIFDLPGSSSYGTQLINYIFSLSKSSGSIPSQQVLTANSVGDTLFTEKSVAIQAPSAFTPYTISSPEAATTAMKYGSYNGVVITPDEANAYIAVPLTLSGTFEQIVARKRLFDEIVNMTLSHNTQQVPIPANVMPIDPIPGNTVSLDKTSGQLFVNGKPFFPKAVYYGTLNGYHHMSYDSMVSYYKAHDLNTIIQPVNYYPGDNINYLENYLNTCQKYGMKVIFYLGAIYRDEWILDLMRFRNDPALIGYILQDDGYWWEYNAINRETNLIRKYDTKNFLEVTLYLDFRNPNRVADPTAWDRWKTYYSQPGVFPLPYLYPIMKDGYYMEPDIIGGGGFDDYYRMANNVQSKIGYRYQHQWLQTGMQFDAFTFFGLSFTDAFNETFIPSAEQMRLELYEEMIAGVKGDYLFFHPFLLESGLGRGRINTIDIIFRKMDMINNFITLGTWTPTSTVNYSSQIDAANFQYNGSTVTMLRRKNYPQYIDYVDDSTLTNVEIQKPQSGASYLIDFPEIDTLQTDSVITLKNFDLTTTILTTNDNAVVDSIKTAMTNELAKNARCALEVLKDKRAKTEAVTDKVGSYKTLPSGVPDLLSEGRAEYNQVLIDFKAGNYVASYNLCHTVMLIYRKIQRLMMQQAEAYWQTNLGGNNIARKYLAFYFGIPKFYQLYANGQAVAPGELGNNVLSKLAQLDKEIVSSVNNTNSRPETFALYQNYPNPFNPTTMIKYQIPKSEFVSLKVYDILGRQVSVLVNKEQKAGTYSIEYGVRSKDLASGVYFYRIQAGNFIQVKKMLLIK